MNVPYRPGHRSERSESEVDDASEAPGMEDHLSLSEASHARSAWSSTKLQEAEKFFFSIMYLLVTKNELFHRLAGWLVVVDWLQVLGFIISSHEFAWHPRLVVPSDILHFFQFYFASIRVGEYWFLFSVAVLAGATAVIVGKGSNKKTSSVLPVRVLRFVLSLSITILYIPSLKVLLSMMFCRPPDHVSVAGGLPSATGGGTASSGAHRHLLSTTTTSASASSSHTAASVVRDLECWTNTHIFYFVVSSCVLLVYISGVSLAALTYFDPEPRSKSLVAKQHSRLDCFFVFLKTVLSVVKMYLLSETGNKIGITGEYIGCAVITVIAFIMIVAHLAVLPYFSYRMNQIRAAFLSSIMWSAICLVATVALNDRTNPGPSIALAAGFLPSMLLGALAVRWRVLRITGVVTRAYAASLVEAAGDGLAAKRGSKAGSGSKTKASPVPSSPSLVPSPERAGSASPVVGAATHPDDFSPSADSESDDNDGSSDTASAAGPKGSGSANPGSRLLGAVTSPGGASTPGRSFQGFSVGSPGGFGFGGGGDDDDKEDGLHVWEYEIASRALLMATPHGQEPDPGLVAAATQCFRRGRRKFPNSAFLLGGLLTFLEEWTTNLAEALEVRTAMKTTCHPSFDLRFHIYRHERDDEHRKGSSGVAEMDLVTYLEFTKNYEVAKKKHVEAQRLTLLFWRGLLNGTINNDTIVGSVKSISAATDKARVLYTTLLRRFPKSVRILRSYGRFLEDVDHDLVGSLQCFIKADMVEGAQERAAEEERRRAAARTDALTLELQQGGIAGAADKKLQSLGTMNLDGETRAVVIASETMEIIAVTAKVSVLFGHKKKSLIGSNVSMLMPSPYSEQHDHFVKAYLNGGTSDFVNKTAREVEALHANGGTLTVSLSVTETRAGAKRFFIAVFIPVKDKVPTCCINGLGVILSLNHQFAKTFGYAVDDLRGRKINMVMRPEDAIKHDGYLSHFIREKSWKENADTFVDRGSRAVLGVHRKGHIIPVALEVSAAFERGSRGLATVVGAESLHFNGTLTKIANLNAVLTIDTSGVIQSCNKDLCLLFGYRKDDLLGANVSMLMPSPMSEFHSSYLERYLSTGQAQILGKGWRRVEGVRSDGSPMSLRLSIWEVNVGGRTAFAGRLRPTSTAVAASRAAAEGTGFAAGTPTAQIKVNRVGEVTSVDAVAVSAFGLEPERVIGQPVSTVFDPRSAEYQELVGPLMQGAVPSLSAMVMHVINPVSGTSALVCVRVIPPAGAVVAPPSHGAPPHMSPTPPYGSLPMYAAGAGAGPSSLSLGPAGARAPAGAAATAAANAATSQRTPSITTLHHTTLEFSRLESWDVLVTASQNGDILFVNDFCEVLLGYKPSELIGQNVRILAPEPHRANHDNYLKAYLETGRRHIIGMRRSVQAVRKDGSLAPVFIETVEQVQKDGSKRFLARLWSQSVGEMELEANGSITEGSDTGSASQRSFTDGTSAAEVEHESSVYATKIANLRQRQKDLQRKKRELEDAEAAHEEADRTPHRPERLRSMLFAAAFAILVCILIQFTVVAVKHTASRSHAYVLEEHGLRAAYAQLVVARARERQQLLQAAAEAPAADSAHPHRRTLATTTTTSSSTSAATDAAAVSRLLAAAARLKLLHQSLFYGITALPYFSDATDIGVKAGLDLLLDAPARARRSFGPISAPVQLVRANSTALDKSDLFSAVNLLGLAAQSVAGNLTQAGLQWQFMTSNMLPPRGLLPKALIASSKAVFDLLVAAEHERDISDVVLAVLASLIGLSLVFVSYLPTLRAAHTARAASLRIFFHIPKDIILNLLQEVSGAAAAATFGSGLAVAEASEMNADPHAQDAHEAGSDAGGGGKGKREKPGKRVGIKAPGSPAPPPRPKAVRQEHAPRLPAIPETDEEASEDGQALGNGGGDGGGGSDDADSAGANDDGSSSMSSPSVRGTSPKKSPKKPLRSALRRGTSFDSDAPGASPPSILSALNALHAGLGSHTQAASPLSNTNTMAVPQLVPNSAGKPEPRHLRHHHHDHHHHHHHDRDRGGGGGDDEDGGQPGAEAPSTPAGNANPGNVSVNVTEGALLIPAKDMREATVVTFQDTVMTLKFAFGVILMASATLAVLFSGVGLRTSMDEALNVADLGASRVRSAFTVAALAGECVARPGDAAMANALLAEREVLRGLHEGLSVTKDMFVPASTRLMHHTCACLADTDPRLATLSVAAWGFAPPARIGLNSSLDDMVATLLEAIPLAVQVSADLGPGAPVAKSSQAFADVLGSLSLVLPAVEQASLELSDHLDAVLRRSTAVDVAALFTGIAFLILSLHLVLLPMVKDLQKEKAETKRVLALVPLEIRSKVPEIAAILGNPLDLKFVKEDLDENQQVMRDAEFV